MSRTISAVNKLRYAALSVEIAFKLEADDKAMRYQALCREIGLLGEGERWTSWHQGRVREILFLARAVDSAPTNQAKYGRFVGKDGKPGDGFKWTSRIAIEDAQASGEKMGAAVCTPKGALRRELRDLTGLRSTVAPLN
jgi:hypothetical protein